MYQNNILRHIDSGELLVLVRKRKSDVNTFVVVDESGKPIIKKRSWNGRKDEQLRIIKGFNNLIQYKQKTL